MRVTPAQSVVVIKENPRFILPIRQLVCRLPKYRLYLYEGWWNEIILIFFLGRFLRIWEKNAARRFFFSFIIFLFFYYIIIIVIIIIIIGFFWVFLGFVKNHLGFLGF